MQYLLVHLCFDVTFHMRSGAELPTLSVLSVLKKLKILDHLGVLILSLE